MTDEPGTGQSWFRMSHRTHALGLSAVLGLSLGCTTDQGPVDPIDDALVPTTSGTGEPTVGVHTTAGIDAGDGGDENGEGSDEGSDARPPTKFDVGSPLSCQFRDAGQHCEGTTSLVCDENGGVASSEQCTSTACLDDIGCADCLSGQFDCRGNHVMTCDTEGDSPTWVSIEVCDPEDCAGPLPGQACQGCDLAMGACVYLQPQGSVTPTGVYYHYAEFDAAQSPFISGYDVDSRDDRLYVTNLMAIEVYEVDLLDSDGDGDFEPNQHPDNLDDLGEIEERVLTHIETIPWETYISMGAAEIYVAEHSLFVGGLQITERDNATGNSTIIQSPPPWLGHFSCLGYDDVHGVWYSSHEGGRQVFTLNNETNTWGLAFYFPPLAGDHMDGLEVVASPAGIPYVYVSDMTSDFIGQYRKDPVLGWVQENLFEYQGTAAVAVEGLGFGTFNHFWATSGMSVYEVGGGDLATYTAPPD